MYTDGAGFVSFCILALALMLAVASAGVLVQSLGEFRELALKGRPGRRPRRNVCLSCVGLLLAATFAALGVWLLS